MRPYNARPGYTDVVVSLEVVLPSGEVLRTGSPAAMGYEDTNPYARLSWGPDLAGIFRGSLGYYGIITKAVVRLYPAGDSWRTLTFGFPSLHEMLGALRGVQRADIGVSALGINAENLRLSVTSPSDRSDPDRVRLIEGMIRSSPWFFTVELAGFKGRVEAEEAESKRICGGFDGRIAEFPDKRVMEYLSDASSHRGFATMHHFSGGYMGFWCLMPFGKIQPFVEAIQPECDKIDIQDMNYPKQRARVAWYITPIDRGTTWACGPSISYNAENPPDVSEVSGLVQTLFMTAMEMGATIPLAIPLLTGSIFQPEYRQILLGIKRLVDPNNILVPGKVCKEED
jgi:FAD/FMN-containing dehydrogenase